MILFITRHFKPPLKRNLHSQSSDILHHTLSFSSFVSIHLFVPDSSFFPLSNSHKLVQNHSILLLSITSPGDGSDVSRYSRAVVGPHGDRRSAKRFTESPRVSLMPKTSARKSFSRYYRAATAILTLTRVIKPTSVSVFIFPQRMKLILVWKLFQLIYLYSMQGK